MTGVVERSGDDDGDLSDRLSGCASPPDGAGVGAALATLSLSLLLDWRL